ncbi:hypothetical protein ACWD25_38375 [Streptomyces sp. NPDC002920]
MAALRRLPRGGQLFAHYGVWGGLSEADRSRRTGGDAVPASS